MTRLGDSRIVAQILHKLIAYHFGQNSEKRLLKIPATKSSILLKFILKSSGIYAGLATAFSLIGIFPIFGEYLPKSYLIGNPLVVSGISIEHVVGHVVFGLIVGFVTLSIRYILVAGLFPIALDSDHLVQFLNIDAVPRLGHSFLFGIISVPIMMYAIGKKDYRLGAISMASVLTHISFDILLSGKSGSQFPILIPVSNKMLMLIGQDWIFFLLAALIICATGTFFAKNLTNKTQI